MKKVLLMAPMSSMHSRFGKVNIQTLMEMEVEIYVAANFHQSSHDIEYMESLKRQKITVYDLPFKRRSLRKNLRVIQELRAILKREKFDMVHCNTETGGLLMRLAMGAYRKAIYIYTPHGMSFYKGSSLKSQLVYRPVEWWICSKMKANIAMNQEEFEVLRNWNVKTARFVHGIGFDIDKVKRALPDRETGRKNLGFQPDSFLLLSVGELSGRKNHEVILKAISLVEDNDNIRYLICGEGSEREHLENLAESLMVKDKVSMPGFVQNIEDMYKLADVFVFPSLYEGLPVSVMEAMAAPLPIVCSNIRGNVDMIEDGKGGFLCSPTSAEEFAKAIGCLKDNAQLREKMKEINRSNAENYSSNVVNKEIEEIYRRVIYG